MTDVPVIAEPAVVGGERAITAADQMMAMRIGELTRRMRSLAIARATLQPPLARHLVTSATRIAGTTDIEAVGGACDPSAMRVVAVPLSTARRPHEGTA